MLDILQINHLFIKLKYNIFIRRKSKIKNMSVGGALQFIDKKLFGKLKCKRIKR